MNCPNCNENLDDSDSFCYKCGEEISSKEEQNTKKETEKNTSNNFSSTIKILIFVFIVVFIVGSVISFTITSIILEDPDSKNNINNSSNNSDLYSEWNQYDDYPNIDKVNYKYDTNIPNIHKESISDYGINKAMDKDYIKTSAGIYPHQLTNSTMKFLDNYYLFNISSEDYFSVYVIEGNTTKIQSNLFEDPSSLHSYETVNKYTKFKIKEYNEIIKVNKNNYVIVYAVPGQLPNGSIEEQLEYAGKNIKISGKVEEAGYIPYSAYKSKNPARFMMKNKTIVDE